MQNIAVIYKISYNMLVYLSLFVSMKSSTWSAD